MLTFYCMDTNLFQIRIGAMDIYFSFKMPIAYRSKQHGLRIRGEEPNKMCDDITRHKHIEIITVCNQARAMFMDKDNFQWELEDQFKRTIYDLAKKCTLERMGFNVSKQRNTCEPGDLPAGPVKKR